MKLHIIARGRIGQSPEAELVERYAQRLRGRLVVTEIGDTAPWPLFGIHLGPGRTVALDERGRDLPSTDLAALLARWRDLTLAFLVGLMLGSLNKVWPWKETLSWRIDSRGEQVPLLENNLLPGQFAEISGQDPQLLFAVLLAIGGIVLVLGLEWLASRRPVDAGRTE